MARELRSWTIQSQGGLSTSRSCAVRNSPAIFAGSRSVSSAARAASNRSSFQWPELEPRGVALDDRNHRAAAEGSEE